MDAKGKIVLYNGYLNYDPYERIKRAGALGAIAFSGSIQDTPEDMELALRMLRPKMTDAFGDLYAVNVRAADALDMVRRGASRVRMVVRARNVELTSHNVYATIPGTTYPDEIVSLGAHYDSVEYSKGVYDNGAGSVILTELMRHFSAHPARRTLKFMWFGSEEVGLCGSTHFCEAHEAELKRHKIMINVDVAAPILGCDKCIVMGDDALEHYVRGMMRRRTASRGCVVRHVLQRFDTVCRSWRCGGQLCSVCGAGRGVHTRPSRHDGPSCAADALGKTLRYAFTFTDKVANAPVFPV